MTDKKPQWEGFFLLAFLTYTVLLGVAYELRAIFSLSIPWIALPFLALVIAFAVRFLSERARRKNTQ